MTRRAPIAARGVCWCGLPMDPLVSSCGKHRRPDPKPPGTEAHIRCALCSATTQRHRRLVAEEAGLAAAEEAEDLGWHRLPAGERRLVPVYVCVECALEVRAT